METHLPDQKFLLRELLEKYLPEQMEKQVPEYFRELFPEFFPNHLLLYFLL
jgi:hypothetical protein